LLNIFAILQLEDAESTYQKERKQRIEEEEEEDEQEDADEAYLRRCESGLETLQSIAFLIGFVCTAGDSKVSLVFTCSSF
jgi:hypothetical protein